MYFDGEQADVSVRADSFNSLSFEAFSKCKHISLKTLVLVINNPLVQLSFVITPLLQ